MEFSSGQNVSLENFQTAHLSFKLPWAITKFSPLHFILYLQQMATILLTANISVAPDTLFTSLFYYLSGHVDILNSNIQNEKGMLDEKEGKMNMKLAMEKYDGCIAQHRTLIK